MQTIWKLTIAAGALTLSLGAAIAQPLPPPPPPGAPMGPPPALGYAVVRSEAATLRAAV